jgi:hypothetical protein
LRVPRRHDADPAKGDDDVADDEGRGMRTLRHVGRVLILVERRGVLLLPRRFPRREVDRGDDLLRIAAAVNEHAAAGHDRR